MKRAFLVGLGLLLMSGGFLLYRGVESLVAAAPPAIGAPLDSLNGVIVYYNGGMGNVSGRNVVDGYNVGLRYQCVEFVKRYYLETHDHRMPNSYGHAKDLFDTELGDSTFNTSRGLIQVRNGRGGRPHVGDLVVFSGWTGNPYGHVAIVSQVHADAVEVIQQNTGSTRQEFGLERETSGWRVKARDVLGWLRLP